MMNSSEAAEPPFPDAWAQEHLEILGTLSQLDLDEPDVITAHDHRETRS
jgi:hypothetical protein